MKNINTDNIPLTVLTEIDDAIYENAEIGLFYLDKTVDNEYVNRVVEILEYLGYKVEVSNPTYPRNAKHLSIEFGKPTKPYEACELDCAIDMTTADEACMQARSNQYEFGILEEIVNRTYKQHKRGKILKEDLSNIWSIMGGTELWWLEAYNDIHVHTINNGNTVVFEVKG